MTTNNQNLTSFITLLQNKINMGSIVPILEDNTPLSNEPIMDFDGYPCLELDATLNQDSIIHCLCLSIGMQEDDSEETSAFYMDFLANYLTVAKVLQDYLTRIITESTTLTPCSFSITMDTQHGSRPGTAETYWDLTVQVTDFK